MHVSMTAAATRMRDNEFDFQPTGITYLALFFALEGRLATLELSRLMTDILMHVASAYVNHFAFYS